MHIYNTLTRRKEEFKPINEGKVNFYLCGPTVYDKAHLGHGRSATAFDIVRRYFIYRKFDVNFVSNYTDIDDKMINRANERGISVQELADEIIPMYKEDYARLKIMEATTHPKATEYIGAILNLITDLKEKNAVYELEDGMYFDIKKFPQYGKLSGQNLEDLQMGARVAVNEKKKNPQDFAVWKKAKPGEPAWDSPWGKGRPGWHIECSAMSMTLFGESFDIHGGGADLTFPHHECEIAQSETATGKPFANYWMHNGFININEEKMSKSLGNFITLRDLLNQYSGEIIRFLYLQTHYRSPINFTDDLVKQAENTLVRIHDFVKMIRRDKINGQLHNEIKEFIAQSKEKFETSMDDDFETSGAIAAVFDLIKNVNVFLQANQLSSADQSALMEYLNAIDTVFALIVPKIDDEIDDEIKALIKAREDARLNKDWAKSDEIRDQLKSKGIILEDSSNGTIWKRI
ncbi:cysteine--tRNA ligase [Patescibacteria group bacterium]|nr:cysteine--tRNA ligase [Patescibacteria group bacterium]